MSEVMIHLIECIRCLCCLCGEQQQYNPTLNQCLIWKYQWKKVSNAIKPQHAKQFRVVFVLFCVSLCKVNISIQVQCASAPYRLCCAKATHITENGTHCFAHEAIESFYFAQKESPSNMSERYLWTKKKWKNGERRKNKKKRK